MNAVKNTPRISRTQAAGATEGDPRWAAVVARDPDADGRFFYSVRTTGVYCRPSCAARLARPENVRFHSTCEDAERAGFRACKRCKPGQPRPERVRGPRVASDRIETSRQLLDGQRRENRMDEASGEIRFAIEACSLGSILVALGERGIRSILIGDDPHALVRELQRQCPQATPIEKGANDEAALRKRVDRVLRFVEAPVTDLDLSLDVRGTAFQQRVWTALQDIPAGSTASYGDIARRIGAPGSARAVAQACASNTIAVAIPCHRVVRNDGGLSGYRWGVERKRALLEREARA
jgi:AraC family transcriptional regulator of adaptative response/methylated-DNA-[protein]-cysteine methyltransferase